ncbi:MAG: phosphoserine phosphatase SerB [Arenicellales bacterium]|jgi:phosphoserine phosphatase|nr:phosphoserine phosphatase SerB [Arenicellales bacterium]|tara:strand:+ start:316 stop:1602 length:1287 start_codon:yes stop_codon:yes gene_type:complete
MVDRTDSSRRELTLINVNGQDRPGITAALTTVLARYKADVLDIGQAVIHDYLSWGLLVEVPPGKASGLLYRDLMFAAHELNLNIRFRPITENHYREWVNNQGQSRHIITLLGQKITAQHFSWIADHASASNLNIDKITRLSGRIPLGTKEAAKLSAIELSVQGEVDDLAAMHGEYLHASQEMDIDIAIQKDDAYRRLRRLVCFDMDSTLIQNEVINDLAEAAGVGQKVAEITEAAMQGAIDFEASFHQRVALLKGLEADRLPAIAEAMVISEGTERLISTLRQYGYRTAILSGGFTYFAEHLKSRLGVDYIYANELEIVEGRLTGRVVGRVVDENRKATLLKEIALRENLCLEQVIAVGDGANDLPMLSIAGLGIAFRAKPLVQQQARYSLGSVGLDGILYLLGMRDRDIEELSLVTNRGERDEEDRL